MLELKRAIDVRGALSINIITMIGIGPLVTIPLVIAALGGPLALVGWIAGAIVALCDGLVWAELASVFPGSGGTYVYLRNVFGPNGLGRAFAFLFNWQFLLYAPCLLASGYIGFANYAAYLYPSIGDNVYLHDALAVAIGILTIMLLYRRTAQVATLGAILAIIATLTVAIVALAGLSHGNVAQIFHLGAPLRLGVGFLAGFSSALYITLYDYVGYADAALLGDEVVRPERTIPLAIVLSVIIVAVLYVLLQVGVLGAVPWRSLLDAHGQPTVQAQYVGALVVERAWGRVAALGVTVAVLATAFASLYGNLLGFSRISFAAARDGAFFAVFGRLHPSKEIPHVALLVVGGLSLIASLFTLDQVIAFLTAGIVLIQGVAQIVALALLRARRNPGRFQMPLYPLPALIALAGWAIAFIGSGATAIALGSAWLAIGTIVFLAAAWRQRWWPFALAAIVVVALVAVPRLGVCAPQGTQHWSNWNTSRVILDHGYPVFTVEGRPYFPYGAAFFYERIPRDRWRASMLAYKALGINTLDLYCIWNWHAPAQGVLDFNGATDPRRDLLGLLSLAHQLGFKLILRPGPVIRNEWRNGGYPGWLLERRAYNMPLHDVLEGRYPATATLQNRHADAAAAEWLANTTHLDNAASWLREVLHAVEPYSRDVLAIALDDDQGAYLDNDTWPAPHWHAYIGWLRQTVQSVTGRRVPLFINTYEMKVPAASPAWAWGNWYQSNSYRLNDHDLADLDFATGLLQTQPRLPVMQSEFQAGWLQGADEGAPRPSDPASTSLALGELLRDGAHGIVNFPVQDTIDPHGWEAPWANWSYAWDAALTVDLQAAPRYAPTRAIGDVVRRYGALLARTHVAADAAIVWPPSLFAPGTLSNVDFGELASSTTALQRSCNVRGVSCELVDLAAIDRRVLQRDRFLLAFPPGFATHVTPPAARMLTALQKSGRLFSSLESVPASGPYRGVPNVALLMADDSSYAFVVAIDPDAVRHHIPSETIRLRRRALKVGGFDVAAGGVRVVPVGVSAPNVPAPGPPPAGSPPPFADPDGTVIANSHLRAVFAPFAGARIAELGDGRTNAATGIGLVRDATFPPQPASSRDYIRGYTHPIAAGTFNRPYACSSEDVLTTRRITCSYDAPDLPKGGALFKRTLTLTGAGSELVVGEQFTPHDSRSTDRLESISGFAFVAGDRLITSARRDALGIVHGGQLAVLRWRSGEVAHVELRRTRGAEIVGLIFTQRRVELRLAAYRITVESEPARLVNQPSSR